MGVEGRDRESKRERESAREKEREKERERRVSRNFGEGSGGISQAAVGVREFCFPTLVLWRFGRNDGDFAPFEHHRWRPRRPVVKVFQSTRCPNKADYSRGGGPWGGRGRRTQQRRPLTGRCCWPRTNRAQAGAKRDLQDLQETTMWIPGVASETERDLPSRSGGLACCSGGRCSAAVPPP